MSVSSLIEATSSAHPETATTDTFTEQGRVPVPKEIVAEVEAALAEIDKAFTEGTLEVAEELRDTLHPAKRSIGNDHGDLFRLY